MINCLRSRLLVYALLLSLPSQAMELDPAFYGGANLISYATADVGNSANRVAPLLAWRSDFVFEGGWGVFLATEWTTRGTTTTGGLDASASFLDIPLGVRLSKGLADGIQIQFHAGGYFSLPLSDLKTATATTQTTQFSYGGYIQTEVDYDIHEKLKLGFGFWYKHGLSDSYKVTTAGSTAIKKIVEFGGGLFLHFKL